MAKVSVIGLGNMGLPMALSLRRGGHDVTGFDLSRVRMEEASSENLRTVGSVKEASLEADFIVLSLPQARNVAAAVSEAGLKNLGGKRRVVIDTSTSEVETSRRIARELDDAGHGFLDAPVSGGTPAAAAGTLTMMIGGKKSDLELARPVLDALGKNIQYVGPSGAGNVAKLVNNLLVAAHMITTSEALKLSIAAGVPAEAILPVLNAATGRSAVSELHVPKWILSETFNSGFTFGLMRKDVRLALELAKAVSSKLPLSEHVAALWRESEDRFEDSVDFTRFAALH